MRRREYFVLKLQSIFSMLLHHYLPDDPPEKSNKPLEYPFWRLYPHQRAIARYVLFLNPQGWPEIGIQYEMQNFSFHFSFFSLANRNCLGHRAKWNFKCSLCHCCQVYTSEQETEILWVLLHHEWDRNNRSPTSIWFHSWLDGVEEFDFNYVSRN